VGGRDRRMTRPARAVNASGGGRAERRVRTAASRAPPLGCRGRSGWGAAAGPNSLSRSVRSFSTAADGRAAHGSPPITVSAGASAAPVSPTSTPRTPGPGFRSAAGPIPASEAARRPPRCGTGWPAQAASRKAARSPTDFASARGNRASSLTAAPPASPLSSPTPPRAS
jgi:hypothetical protein